MEHPEVLADLTIWNICFGFDRFEFKQFASTLPVSSSSYL